jgi:hypothetical protein
LFMRRPITLKLRACIGELSKTPTNPPNVVMRIRNLLRLRFSFLDPGILHCRRFLRAEQYFWAAPRGLRPFQTSANARPDPHAHCASYMPSTAASLVSRRSKCARLPMTENAETAALRPPTDAHLLLLRVFLRSGGSHRDFISLSTSELGAVSSLYSGSPHGVLRATMAAIIFVKPDAHLWEFEHVIQDIRPHRSHLRLHSTQPRLDQ